MPLGLVFPFNFGFLPSTVEATVTAEFLLDRLHSATGAVITREVDSRGEAEQEDRKGKQNGMTVSSRFRSRSDLTSYVPVV